MDWIRYSIGNTRATNTMPMSLGGAPQIQSSGKGVGGGPSNQLIEQARSLMRLVFTRIFGRIN